MARTNKEGEMSNETLRLAEAMEAEMHQELAQQLSRVLDGPGCAAAAAIGDDWLDVRVQFLPDDDNETAQYILHSGDAQFDTDHRGFWGCASLPIPSFPSDRTMVERVARELVDDVLESIAQSE